MEKLESLFFWKTYAWSNHQCGRRWTTLINGKDIAYTFDKYFCGVAQDLSTPDHPLVFNNFPKINKDPGEIALKSLKTTLTLIWLPVLSNKQTTTLSFHLISLNDSLTKTLEYA